MQKGTDPIIGGKYKVTGDIRGIPIVKHEEEETQNACNVSFLMDVGELETLEE